MRVRSIVLVLAALGACWTSAEAAPRKSGRPPAVKLTQPVSISPAPSATPVTGFEQAVRLLKAGRVAEARAMLRAQIKEHPGHLDARRLLVQLLLDGSFDAEAEALLIQGQAQSPQSIDLARSLALLQAQRGALTVALASLEKSRAFASADAEYLSFMAGLCQRLEKHDQANALLEEALAIAPGNADRLYAQWISRRAIGDKAGARMSAEEALASGLLSTEQARQVKAALRREPESASEDEDSP